MKKKISRSLIIILLVFAIISLMLLIIYVNSGVLSGISREWISVTVEESQSEDIYLDEDFDSRFDLNPSINENPINKLDMLARNNNYRLLLYANDYTLVYLGNWDAYTENAQSGENKAFLKKDANLANNQVILEQLKANEDYIFVDQLPLSTLNKEIKLLVPLDKVNLEDTGYYSFYIYNEDYPVLKPELEDTFNNIEVYSSGNNLLLGLKLIFNPQSRSFPYAISLLTLLVSYIFYVLGNFKLNRYRQTIQHIFGQTKAKYFAETMLDTLILSLIAIVLSVLIMSIFMQGLAKLISFKEILLASVFWLVFATVINLIGAYSNKREKERI